VATEQVVEFFDDEAVKVFMSEIQDPDNWHDEDGGVVKAPEPGSAEKTVSSE